MIENILFSSVSETFAVGFFSVGIERGFLSQKGSGEGRGVKEKSLKASNIKVVKDGTVPSIFVEFENAVKEVVSPIAVDETVIKERPSPLMENQFIFNNLLILKKWHPDVNLLKEDVGIVPVWVKLHGVLVTAFSEDGLSGIVLGIPVGQKMGFKPTKQVFQPVSKKPTANTRVNKKKNVEPTKEVSKSNPFEVLTSVENDVEFGNNGGNSNLAGQATNSSGSSFWNMDASSPSNTPIIEKIDKIEKLIIEGKVTLVDDEGKPLEKVASSCDFDSEDEVTSIDNEIASFLAKNDGYGTQSLLEQ
ncbi:retrotransposon protein, putative, unclassified [Tanacetum coccineum]